MSFQDMATSVAQPSSSSSASSSSSSSSSVPFPSRGEFAATLPRPPRLPRLLPPPPAAAELRGNLAALSANNAALRRLSEPGALRAPNALRRARALRAQNRDLARAADRLAEKLDHVDRTDNLEQSSLTPAVSQQDGVAQDLRMELRKVLSEFGEALRESIEAEKNAVAAQPLLFVPADGTPASPVPPSANAGIAAMRGTPGVPSDSGSLLGARAPPRSATSAMNQPDETTSLLSKSISAEEHALIREIRSNDALRRERDAAMRQVQASIEDVNAIFKDLAVMVGDSASQVDYVEVQLGDAGDSVRAARKELDIAQRRRAKRKRFFFCTLLTIAAIFAVFLLILLT